MSTIRRKIVIVTVGLLFFTVLTYKYATVHTTIASPPSKGDLRRSKASLVHTIFHHEDSTGKRTTEKGELAIYGNELNFSNTAQKIVHIKISNTKPKKMVHPPPTLPTAHKKGFFAKDCNHFVDWPSPFFKPGCLKSYELKDNTLSIVIYMKDSLDSLPMQTFLSVMQFTKESQITLSNVVLVFIKDPHSLESHMAHMNAIMDITTKSVPVITTSAETEWKAKLAGVEMANSEQVFVIDDTVIANRDFIQPLLSVLQQKPNSLVIPHVDSLLPVRIYTIYDDKKLHPDSLIWQENWLATYHVAANMTVVRHDLPKIDSLPAQVPSGGLNGEAFAGRRSWLMSLLSKMKTDEVAELSLLSLMCGEGIVVTKCSVVVRANNYELSVPATRDPERVQRLYPLSDTNPKREKIPGCQEVSYYYDTVRKFLAA